MYPNYGYKMANISSLYPIKQTKMFSPHNILLLGAEKSQRHNFKISSEMPSDGISCLLH